MDQDLIPKLLFSFLALVFAVIWLRSFLHGEIYFTQGRGVKRYEGRAFTRWLIYHGFLDGLLLCLAVYSWLAPT